MKMPCVLPVDFTLASNAIAILLFRFWAVFQGCATSGLLSPETPARGNSSGPADALSTSLKAGAR
jgi:hypothetical protein